MTASFRDPSGRLIDLDGRIIRTINKNGSADFRSAAASNSVNDLVEAKNLISVTELTKTSSGLNFNKVCSEYQIDESEVELIVGHERIDVPSYPYEWPAEMLYSAAELTLDIAERVLEDGLGLKDGTPYNILFHGPRPVFVDWLSFEKRDELDAIWLPEAQFLRTFVLPLLAGRNFGLQPGEFFISNRDGLEPEQLSGLVKGFRRIMPPFLSLVTLPGLVGKRNRGDSSIYSGKLADRPEKARFILEHQFRRLRRSLSKVKPLKGRRSVWTGYVGPGQHFTDQYFEHKSELVTEMLSQLRPKIVLDIGCNTGHFSRIAARLGANVVSLDQDSATVGNLWLSVANEDLNILPLVVDITRPSPGIGWRNVENPSFLDRIKGKPDVVMMLAVIHHMMVTERIPLGEIFKLASDISKGQLILEYIPTNDPMFKTIVRGRYDLFEYLTREYFEGVASRSFRIVKKEKLAESGRWLYLLDNE